MTSPIEQLDPRADNFFGYDKDEQCWYAVQTWHVYVHKHRAPKDQYELVYVRGAKKWLDEPTNESIKEFGDASLQYLNDYMAKGEWHGGVQLDDPDAAPISEPFKFNRWYIKDAKEI